MRSRIAVPFTLLLAGVLAACTGGSEGTSSPTKAPPSDPSPATATTTFTSQEPPFTISYPETWSPIEGMEPGDPAIQATGPDGESVNVTLQQLLGSASLERYTEDAVTALESTGLQVEDSRAGTLGGQEASIIVSSSPERQGFRLLQTIAIKDDVVYVVTYAAPPKVFDEASAQTLTDSFTFG